MPREKPRTADEIDAELDTWLDQQAELTTSLSGLKESLESLRSRVPLTGKYPLAEEHITELSELRRLITEGQTQLAEANQRIADLTAQLAASPQPNPPPPPKPDDGPPRPNGPPGPPEQRKTRQGLHFL